MKQIKQKQMHYRLDNHTAYVNNGNAERLYNLGFDIPTNHVYLRGKKWYSNALTPMSMYEDYNAVGKHDGGDVKISAPSLEVAHRWLREVKGIILETKYDKSSWVFTLNGEKVSSSSDYDEASDRAICEVTTRLIYDIRVKCANMSDAELDATVQKCDEAKREARKQAIVDGVSSGSRIHVIQAERAPYALEKQMRKKAKYEPWDKFHKSCKMDLKEFVEACKDGCFIDYDGYGVYADDYGYTSIYISPSDVTRGHYRKDFQYVCWFNK